MAELSASLCAPGEDCAILFARNPIPGRVKSRLWTHLTPEEACRLHWASTRDVMGLLSQALPGVQKWLFWSETPLGDKDGNFPLPAGFRCAIQEGENLGKRMGAAFARAFACGARRVVIFGSDSPTLPPATARQALEALVDGDLVAGPTEDGGYYLIGCRRFNPSLFRNVEWSTSRTFEQTLANAKRLNYRVTTLETWFDLDEWKDVERLLADARRGQPIPANLAAFLKQLQIGGTQAVPDRRHRNKV